MNWWLKSKKNLRKKFNTNNERLRKCHQKLLSLDY